jgi:hypothetical protein
MAAGRPKVENKRDKIIAVKVTQAQRDALRRQSQIEHRGIPDMFRMWIDGYAAQQNKGK